MNCSSSFRVKSELSQSGLARPELVAWSALWHDLKAMKRSDRTRSHPVPHRYGGQWVAWTQDGLRIVAAGKTPDEVRAAAMRAGVKDIAYEWIPPAGERFIGGSR